MLFNVKQLEGLAIGASDGPIGKVKDFYFDDQAWVLRYVVVDTSKWLGGREVLISPYSMGRPDWSAQTLPVTVTKEQVRNSPGYDTELPVSRQYERSYFGYYGYPYYWGGSGLWGNGYYPGTVLTGIDAQPYRGYQGYLRSAADEPDNADPHLRSCNAVKGYHLRARDGEIGHVQGFVLDDSTWSVRYLIVNTSNWWTGHQVLVSPEWISEVDWIESVVTVALDRQAVKDSPIYDPDAPIDRRDEDALYGHYGRVSYWQEPLTRAVA
jgi:hypothetical protein